MPPLILILIAVMTPTTPIHQSTRYTIDNKISVVGGPLGPLGPSTGGPFGGRGGDDGHDRGR